MKPNTFLPFKIFLTVGISFSTSLDSSKGSKGAHFNVSISVINQNEHEETNSKAEKSNKSYSNRKGVKCSRERSSKHQVNNNGIGNYSGVNIT